MQIVTAEGQVSMAVPRFTALVGLALLVPLMIVAWRVNPFVAAALILYTPGILLLAVLGVERIAAR